MPVKKVVYENQKNKIELVYKGLEMRQMPTPIWKFRGIAPLNFHLTKNGAVMSTSIKNSASSANDFSFSFLIFSLFLDKRKIIRLISYEKYFLKRYFS